MSDTRAAVGATAGWGAPRQPDSIGSDRRSSIRTGPHTVLLVLCLAGTAAGTIGALLGAPGSGQIIVAGLVGALPLAITHLRANVLGAAHPLALYGLLLTFGCVGQLIYLHWLAPSDVVQDMLWPSTAEALPRGLGITALAVVTTCVAYLLPLRASLVLGSLLRRVRHYPADAVDQRRLRNVARVLLALSVLALLYFASVEGVSSLRELLVSEKRFVATDNGGTTALGPVRVVMEFAGHVFVVLYFVKLRNRIRWVSPVGLICIASLLLALVQAIFLGSRTTVLFPIVVAWAASVPFKRRKGLSFRTIAFAACFVGALVYLGAIRNSSSNEERAANPLSADNFVGFTVGSQKFGSVSLLTIIVDRVPEHYRYQNGRTMLSAIVAPIPRSVWPGKPQVRLGRDLGVPVYGFPSHRLTGAPPGLVGESYINFGVAGVVLVGAVLGRVMRSLAMLGEKYANSGFQMLFISLWSVVVVLKGIPSEYAALLPELVISTASVWVIVRLSSSSRTHARRA